MIVHHFETRGGWKFTDFLNTDLAIPHRAHKRFKIKNKNKNKRPKKRGRIKKKTKIHLLRFEPPNPRARQEHDQRTVGQRQSVSECGCCFNFVEYIAVKKECINQQRKKKRRKKYGLRSRNRTQHHRLHATSPYHETTQNDYVFSNCVIRH